MRDHAIRRAVDLAVILRLDVSFSRLESGQPLTQAIPILSMLVTPVRDALPLGRVGLVVCAQNLAMALRVSVAARQRQ